MTEMEVDRLLLDRMLGKNADRPQLTEMMGFVRDGDTVIVEPICSLFWKGSFADLSYFQV